MKPKVSIIIPNYNHAAFLQQRLDSVFNQTYQNFEVILLDDASTDGSGALLQTYAEHPKVSQIEINKTNSGSPFKQWQKGINLAKGDYIWIAESDDYCELNFLEVLMSRFLENTVLVYSASVIINSSGIKKGRHKWADGLDKNRWKKDFTNTGKQEIKQYLRYRNTITNASAVIFKKAAIKKIKIPVTMKFCGDWLLWIELLKQGDVSYTVAPLNYFRRHQNTTRTIKALDVEKKRYFEYFRIIKNESNFISRLFSLKKYRWIFEEWNQKSNNFYENAYRELKIPDVLLLYYLISLKK